MKTILDDDADFSQMMIMLLVITDGIIMMIIMYIPFAVDLLSQNCIQDGVLQCMKTHKDIIHKQTSSFLDS